MIFKSKWITYSTGEYKSADDKYGNPSPYFRKSFSVNAKIKRATIFVSALGVFKVYLNGYPVDRDFLSPGWVDYRKKLPFIRYDITDKIKSRNAVGIVLGDGWAVGHLGSNYAFKRCGYSDRIELTALIRIEYYNGHIEEISTDKSWRASTGSIRRSDIYMGELIDNRFDLGNFSDPEYDDKGWSWAEEVVFKFSRNLFLEEAIAPKVVTKHIIEPLLISKKENRFLYDLEQNIAGVLSVELKGKRGAKITVRHGELISDGALYVENLRKAEATDTFILSGASAERFRPLFTYHGFRYAEITVDGDAEILNVTAEVMYSDLTPSGEFGCSDEIVNKIYLSALWGQRGNFLGLPTDCPQRDERLGWTADAQTFARSAMWNMNCKSFYEKYLADIRDAQLGNGVIPSVAPVPPVGSFAYTGRDAAAGWSEAIGQIPYDHYIMYGDEQVIRKNLHAVKGLISYYEVESPDMIRSGEGAYGDWLSLGTPSDLSAISTLFYARVVRLAAKMCRIISDSDENYYNELYLSIKKAFNNHFINEEGKIKSDTQSLYAIAYKFGIIDVSLAEKNLVRKFAEDGGKLTSGFLGIKYLLPTLCDIGRSDIAYSLITSTEYPGWGYSIVNGATTIWEHWDSYTVIGGIRPGMNSFNHYSLGSCVEWMYEYCLGIKPLEDGAGFKKIRFNPYFDLNGYITNASGSYESPYGKISVSWSKMADTNTYEYTVSVPDKIKYTFDFNDMTVLSEEQDSERIRFLLTPKL